MNEFKMATTTVQTPFGELKKYAPGPREREPSDQFANWFSRSRNTLHFMADLILDSSEMAERAVQNCWRETAGNPPSFASEGDFRSWIFRILINEALSMPSPEPRECI
jgi:DNA-directed RNA polymerase specialized sigma24 family protein